MRIFKYQFQFIILSVKKTQKEVDRLFKNGQKFLSNFKKTFEEF